MSRHKKTNAEFQREVFNLVDNDYTFLDSYVNARTKIRVKHNECGHIYEVRPDHFLSGERCPYCSTKAKKTNAQFKQEIFNLVDNEYTFPDAYQGAFTKLRVKHNKCGHVYKVEPDAFLRGNRCAFCNGNHKKTDAEFKQEVFNLVDNEYVFLEPYINARIKIKVKHNTCGNVYRVTPTNFLQGSRCPYCNTPKGETIITEILDTLNIDYEVQKTFDGLKDKSYLSYDFYISDQNILIEYQGIQHYQPLDHFGGEDQFKLQQKHDKMKSDYAKSNNYNLIAVPYTKDTFSKIKKYLIKSGLKLKSQKRIDF